MNNDLVAYGRQITVADAKRAMRNRFFRQVMACRKRLAKEAITGADAKSDLHMIELWGLYIAVIDSGLDHGWAWEIQGWLNDLSGMQQRNYERLLEKIHLAFDKYNSVDQQTEVAA